MTQWMTIFLSQIHPIWAMAFILLLNPTIQRLCLKARIAWISVAPHNGYFLMRNAGSPTDLQAQPARFWQRRYILCMYVNASWLSAVSPSLAERPMRRFTQHLSCNSTYETLFLWSMYSHALLTESRLASCIYLHWGLWWFEHCNRMINLTGTSPELLCTVYAVQLPVHLRAGPFRNCCTSWGS